MVRLTVVICALVAVGLFGIQSVGQTPGGENAGPDDPGARAADPRGPEPRGVETPRKVPTAAPSLRPSLESRRAIPRQSPAQHPVAPSSGKSVALDVTIAEFLDPAKSATTLPLESGQKTLERIRELESQGKSALVTRVRLSTLDGQSGMLQIGEQASVATGRRFGGGRAGAGFEAPVSYSRQNIGLIIGATPRVADDGSVTVDLEVEKSQIAPRSPRGADEEAPPGVTNLRSQTTIHIPAGETVIVGGMQMSSQSESGRTLILVSSQVSPGAAKPHAPDAQKSGAREETQTKMFQLRFASATAAAKLLHNLYRSPTLVCSPEERTNMLIARGLPGELAEIEAVLDRLDQAGNK
jgi:type II secretory pathway component GspD/PulD (secretin)